MNEAQQRLLEGDEGRDRRGCASRSAPCIEDRSSRGRATIWWGAGSFGRSMLSAATIEILRRIVGAARVGEEVALQRRVHPHRGDVPDREQRETATSGEAGSACPPSRMRDRLAPKPVGGQRTFGSVDAPSPALAPRRSGRRVRSLTHHRNVPLAGRGGRDWPLREIPASRECRACARAGSRIR